MRRVRSGLGLGAGGEDEADLDFAVGVGEFALDAVLGAFQQGEPSPFTPEEILNVSRVTFAMVESSLSQAPVEIERG